LLRKESRERRVDTDGTVRDSGSEPRPISVYTFEPGVLARIGGHYYEDVCGTLRAKAGDNQMTIAYSIDTYISHEQANTLAARDYKQPQAVVYWDGTQKVGTLTAKNAGGGQRMPDKMNFNCVIVSIHKR
jgi:hypothetical protein